MLTGQNPRITFHFPILPPKHVILASKLSDISALLFITHTMRTRFLAAAVTAVTDPVETPGFYHLPLPHLTPPKFSSFSTNSAHSFDEIPFFGVSREIDKLPIDDALSIFLADVVPHFVCDADIQQPQIDSNTERYEVNYMF